MAALSSASINEAGMDWRAFFSASSSFSDVIVSGRDIAGLRKVAPVTRDVTLVGSHGAEISDSDHELTKHQRDLLKRLIEEVTQTADSIPGVTSAPPRH